MCSWLFHTVWKVKPRVKASKQHSVLTEANKRIIHEIKGIKPVDLKMLKDKLLLFMGICRFLVGRSHLTSVANLSYLDFLVMLSYYLFIVLIF